MIVNEKVQDVVEKIAAILTAEHSRVDRNAAIFDSLEQTEGK